MVEALAHEMVDPRSSFDDVTCWMQSSSNEVRRAATISPTASPASRPPLLASRFPDKLFTGAIAPCNRSSDDHRTSSSDRSCSVFGYFGIVRAYSCFTRVTRLYKLHSSDTLLSAGRASSTNYSHARAHTHLRRNKISYNAMNILLQASTASLIASNRRITPSDK